MSPLAEMTLSENALDFIDDARLIGLLAGPAPDAAAVRDVVAKSLEKHPLGLEETVAPEDFLVVEWADLRVVEYLGAARGLGRVALVLSQTC